MIYVVGGGSGNGFRQTDAVLRVIFPISTTSLAIDFINSGTTTNLLQLNPVNNKKVYKNSTGANYIYYYVVPTNYYNKTLTITITQPDNDSTESTATITAKLTKAGQLDKTLTYAAKQSETPPGPTEYIIFDENGFGSGVTPEIYIAEPIGTLTPYKANKSGAIKTVDNKKYYFFAGGIYTLNGMDTAVGGYLILTLPNTISVSQSGYTNLNLEFSFGAGSTANSFTTVNHSNTNYSGIFGVYDKDNNNNTNGSNFTGNIHLGGSIETNNSQFNQYFKTSTQFNNGTTAGWKQISLPISSSDSIKYIAFNTFLGVISGTTNYEILYIKKLSLT